MREYELLKYERWQNETEKILPLLMKRNLLVVSTSSADVGGSQVMGEMVCGRSTTVSDVTVDSWKRYVKYSLCLFSFQDPATRALHLDRNVRYHLNFAPEIKEIISETMYLEQLGFSVPELAQNVSLQGEKFLLLYEKSITATQINPNYLQFYS